MSEENPQRLVLIDGHAMLYRAFFAFPQTLTTRNGELINAVYGFTRMLLNVVRDLEPTHLVVSFDVGETFRHKEFEPYKAHREKMPDELKEQEPRVYEVLKALNVPVKTKENYEADDVIGTLSKTAAKRGVEAVIVTGDMDALQLVEDSGEKQAGVRVYRPGTRHKPNTMYQESTVEHEYELKPLQIIDMKGLAGDSSDNIPGVRGIGQKTAVRLLKGHESIENIYRVLGVDEDEVLRLSGGSQTTRSAQDDISSLKSLEEMSSEEQKKAGFQPSVVKKLRGGIDDAFESKRLVTIVTDVPIEFDLESCEVQRYDKEEAVKLFEELEFTSLVRMLPNDAFEESVQEALF